jgi:hypothetical protein
VDDGRVDSIGVRGDTRHVDRASDGPENRDGEVRRAVGNDTHGDKHDHQVDEDSGIRKPAKLLKCSHLSQKELNPNVSPYHPIKRTVTYTATGPYDTANSIAQLEFGYLGDRLTVAD